VEITYEELVDKLQIIMNEWHLGTRQGNDGNQGNTLEDLLGIEENNISLPDIGNFEIKTQKAESGSLITLFHKEPYTPSPAVPGLLLRLGWKAGNKYPSTEMSFRSTTYAHGFSVRGFSIEVNNNMLDFIFDPTEVATSKIDKTKVYATYGDWLNDVIKRDPNYIDHFPVQYRIDDITNKFKEKLENTIFVTCKTKTKDGKKFYYYNEGFILGEIIEYKIQEVYIWILMQELDIIMAQNLE